MPRKTALDDAVAEAIYEHWLPRHAGDELPQSKPGILLSLADKLDSLVGLMAVGERATASADPFGLRRAALGVIRIILENELDVCFPDLCRIAEKVLPFEIESEEQLKEQRRESTRQFLCQRLNFWFMDTNQDIETSERVIDGVHVSSAHGSGYSLAVIDAVMAEFYDWPHRAAFNIDQMKPWTEKSNWNGILDGFARCARITKDIASDSPIHASFLTEPAEIVLHQEYQGAREKVDQKKDVDTAPQRNRNHAPRHHALF